MYEKEREGENEREREKDVAIDGMKGKENDRARNEGIRKKREEKSKTEDIFVAVKVGRGQKEKAEIRREMNEDY